MRKVMDLVADELELGLSMEGYSLPVYVRDKYNTEDPSPGQPNTISLVPYGSGPNDGTRNLSFQLVCRGDNAATLSEVCYTVIEGTSRSSSDEEVWEAVTALQSTPISSGLEDESMPRFTCNFLIRYDD